MVFSDLLIFQRTGMTSRAIHDRIEREMNSAQTLGGADWNRTSDPLLAKQVLSQLSYSPILGGKSLSLMSCAWCSENQDSDGGPG